MKNLLIFLFIFFSINLFAYDLKEYLLSNDTYPDLATGMEKLSEQKLNDFSKPFAPSTTYQMKSYNVNPDNEFYAGFSTEGFYNLDFSEDPFDGLIEILVVGEPSTSTNLTLLIAGLLGIAMFTYKKKYMPA